MEADFFNASEKKKRKMNRTGTGVDQPNIQVINSTHNTLEPSVAKIKNNEINEIWIYKNNNDSNNKTEKNCTLQLNALLIVT